MSDYKCTCYEIYLSHRQERSTEFSVICSVVTSDVMTLCHDKNVNIVLLLSFHFLDPEHKSRDLLLPLLNSNISPVSFEAFPAPRPSSLVPPSSSAQPMWNSCFPLLCCTLRQYQSGWSSGFSVNQKQVYNTSLQLDGIIHSQHKSK